MIICRTTFQAGSSSVSPLRALANKPAIILADEPTGNLDSKTGMEVIGLLKTTSKKFNQTIVMITHNEEIAQLADRIIHIEDGKIVGGGRLLEFYTELPFSKVSITFPVLLFCSTVQTIYESTR